MAAPWPGFDSATPTFNTPSVAQLEGASPSVLDNDMDKWLPSGLTPIEPPGPPSPNQLRWGTPLK